MIESCAKKLLPLMLLALLWGQTEAQDWQAARQIMINEIKADVVDTARYIGKSKLDDRVMDVMARVPRHKFVPRDQQSYSYENRPLSIGYGQTISQPYIVALMTDLLQPHEEDVMLEVGTGSGYQAAVLSYLVKKVYSMEIIPELAVRARKQIKEVGINNVVIRSGDGFFGWPEKGPFDGIIVTAVGSQIPPPLIKQLTPGGRMIIPVGDRFSVQYLLLIEKDSNGTISTRQVLPVSFVPLTGDH